MSIVQTFLTRDFLVMSGDTRAYKDSKINENYRKVFRINDYSAIGITGVAENCQLLFSDYINTDFQIIENDDFLAQTIQNIDEKFAQLKRNNFQPLKVSCIIAGWNGSNFGRKLYKIQRSSDGLEDDVEVIDELYAYSNTKHDFSVCSSRDYYFEMFNDYFVNSVNEGKPLNIRMIKNLMMDVVDKGVELDLSINNKLDFITMRRCDFNKGAAV